MQVFCGLPDTNFQYQRAVEQDGIPVLLSANPFWDNRKKKFKDPSRVTDLTIGNPVVLDSGGFEAMRRYGGYRWTVAEYIEFVNELCPLWWSAMDYCCEPEIASSRQEVENRMNQTIWSLGRCIAHAITWSREIEPMLMPTFVLQGWRPEDYIRSARLIEDHILSTDTYIAGIKDTASPAAGWPDLIGIGSICKRNLKGENGLYKILNALDRILPSNTKFHLFGVKSKAVSDLHGWPRIASVDSMAWSVEAWRAARKAQMPRTITFRAETMRDWWNKQYLRTQKPQQVMELI